MVRTTMDGRVAGFLLLALGFATSGCVTTTEKKVTIRTEDEPPPAHLATTKDDGKKAPPPRLILAFAEMKEKEAIAITDDAPKQAQLRDEARRAYQELLRTEPDNVAAYRGLARVYIRLNDYERAADTYKKAMAKHPREVSLWCDLGMMHNRRKEWPEGIKCFRKALEFDPENQDALKTLGFTLARCGQIDQSVIYLTRAMGSAAAAHHNVALMLLHLAEKEPTNRTSWEEMARQQLRRALQENGSYDAARDLLAQLETPMPTAAATPTPAPGTAEVQFCEPGTAK